ncbi:hypothetical protein A628_04354 [Salmonella enterica subsp. enterica serovar Cubana str. 76814]|uniref:Uncharacterized protein n=1 Tax=Salmonella enterica subsp. enterica serovar Cubana str. 76814 TaxID=1192560 RepID=V7ILB0_SALET|nr:hypothetical protein A628_04354 [Salmonella enterica subsp. enterica serovar Cubana str. 76814]
MLKPAVRSVRSAILKTVPVYRSLGGNQLTKKEMKDYGYQQ